MYFGRAKMKIKACSGCRAAGRVKSWVFQAVLSAFPPSFFLFSLACLFRPQLHVWQHFCLKRHSFPLCCHGCSPKSTLNLLGKLIQLKKLVKSCFSHRIIFRLNWSLMWFSELCMLLVPAECGEWSSGSEEQEELWKKIGLFVGLYVQTV